MAEYIKFRLTAAKVGVSMALMALIAGVAEKVHGTPQVINSKTAAQVNFNKFSGLSKTLKNALLYEQKETITLNNKIAKVYKEYKALSGDLLNIQKADAGFLTSAAASQKYLSLDESPKEFLALGGTAVNSSLLGNHPPSDFFQGHGNVVSGAQTVGTGGSQQLVASPDGAISVLIGLSQPAAGGPPVPTLNLRNNTGQLVPAVQDLSNGGSSSTQSITLQPDDNPVQLSGGTTQLHLQTFPGSGGGFNSIIAVLVSLEPNPSNQSQYLASGQMMDGGA